jgi:trigger factor
MATVTKENLGLLHEKLTVSLDKNDYLPAFEKALKDYAKKANIPGFRKGMVPIGMVKKMYGASVYTDEVLRSVDRELNSFLVNEKLDIFAQPLPLDTDIEQINMNEPADYSFSFEIGMKPEVSLSNLAKGKFTGYKVTVTDEMINNEVERLQNQHGTLTDVETIASENVVMNVIFTEADSKGNEVEGGIKKDNSLLVKYFTDKVSKDLIGKSADHSFTIQLKTAFAEKEREWIVSDLGLTADDKDAEKKYFNVSITKLALLEKKELNEEFFTQLFPGQDVKTEEQMKEQLKEKIAAHWDSQSRNQIQDQIFHNLTDNTDISFPESFLKKWIKTQGEKVKTDEEVETEFPVFLNQLKWTLITEEIVKANNITVLPDDLRNFAKQQILGYLGMGMQDAEQDWIKEYIDKMMKDKKFIEDSYNRIQTQKIFEWAETQIKPTEKAISAEEFTKMVEEHQHEHHS